MATKDYRVPDLEKVVDTDKVSETYKVPGVTGDEVAASFPFRGLVLPMTDVKGQDFFQVLASSGRGLAALYLVLERGDGYADNTTTLKRIRDSKQIRDVVREYESIGPVTSD